MLFVMNICRNFAALPSRRQSYIDICRNLAKSYAQFSEISEIIIAESIHNEEFIRLPSLTTAAAVAEIAAATAPAAATPPPDKPPTTTTPPMASSAFCRNLGSKYGTRSFFLYLILISFE